ncbi:MAG TPA: DUF72 domain-containing protein [Candidatus Bathyarchaeia archaeon]|nr:DUF72 domain-containing protein [Candidatus Bathyarchaeia archaeon]
MGKLLVGAGGWDYFSIPSGDRLRAYASAYDFVEVNSTYYRLPSPAVVASWRKRVVPTFEFSIRCPRDLVERHHLESNSKTLHIIDSTEKICRHLKANVLAILVPKTLVRDEDLSPKLAALFSTINLGNTKIAVEFREKDPSDEVLQTLKDHGAIHSVDVSGEDPKIGSNILYSRLFGKGKENIYEFDDTELRDIATKASSPKFEKSILAFHGVRMYRDAGRMKMFLKTGQFPSLTSHVGLDSLGEVLKEDTRFPISKARLVEVQGWRLFDRTSERRTRAREALVKLPNRTFEDFEDLRVSLERSGL